MVVCMSVRILNLESMAKADIEKRFDIIDAQGHFISANQIDDSCQWMPKENPDTPDQVRIINHNHPPFSLKQRKRQATMFPELFMLDYDRFERDEERTPMAVISIGTKKMGIRYARV